MFDVRLNHHKIVSQETRLESGCTRCKLVDYVHFSVYNEHKLEYKARWAVFFGGKQGGILVH
ncbi:unnamed protein product [Clavelina lepadiformis]|uniref:Uncharacterized protein n=1 Tax=Clavelina lepadiformis TaxID=159417 RepID=A0ABP0F8B5_CLALP